MVMTELERHTERESSCHRQWCDRMDSGVTRSLPVSVKRGLVGLVPPASPPHAATSPTQPASTHQREDILLIGHTLNHVFL